MNINKTKRKNKVTNIIFDVLIVLFGIILLISIYTSFQTKILGNDYASFFGYATFEVQTGSMADYINIGDWIIVKENSDIKINDVITFRKDNSFITHRVIESYNGMYITKGDANNAKDKPIAKNEVIGKVVKILPNFGIIRKTILNPFVLVAVIITLYLFGNVFKKKDKDKTKFLEKIQKKKEVKLEEKKKEIEKEVDEKETEELARTIIDTEVNEEDMDKTAYFRMIPVDKSEIDETYEKIAKAELENDSKEEKKKKVKEPPIEEEIDKKEEEYLFKSNLEMLKKKNKRFNNIIEKILYIKSEEINEIISILTNKKKKELNEASIKTSYLKNYLNVRYYNYANFKGDETAKKRINKLEEVMIRTKEELIKRYSGNDVKYEEKVLKYLNIFKIIVYLEEAYNIDDIETKKKAYKTNITKYLKEDFNSKIILKDAVNDIIKLQRVFRKIINDSLKKLDTNLFELEVNGFNIKNNLYGLNLTHNISFNKIYSDYIIDKTYSEGIVAEDKIIVLMNLLFVNIAKDILEGNFKNKYLIYIPSSIYTKQNKLERIISLLDNEYLKSTITILLTNNDLVKNKAIIKKLVKEEYHFAVNCDKEMIIDKKNYSLLYIVDYIFIDKNVDKINNISNQIPKDIQNKIIFEEVESKVGELEDSKL